MSPDAARRHFRPEPMARRGEGIAWASAILVGATWLLLIQLEAGVILLVPILAVALLLIALSISLGNWVNRSTVLSLGPADVRFKNGLRNAQLAWEDVQEVRVLPAPWGRKVQVIGRQAHFDFNTLGEVQANGRTVARTGFPAGESILEEIVEKAQLQQMEPAAAGLPAGSDYYARR